MLKRRIREVEAISAIETIGLDAKQARFLNLPFYQTERCARTRSARRTWRSCSSCSRRSARLILVAGDLSDPHGTHRMCKEAIDGRSRA
jgi:glucosamine-6-phosphate deaminase